MTDFPITLAGAKSGDTILSDQAAMNRSTAGQWAIYSSHREQMEKLIAPFSPGGRICVLGAGNCNDLDLNWLTQVYAQAHLFDLDLDSLAAGVERQKPAKAASICLYAPFDLIGANKAMQCWRQKPPGDAEILGCISAIEQLPRNREQFDLVLSPCVLSQMLISARQSIGATHPLYPKLRAALLAHHLKMVYRSINPGGRGVIVVDLASTEDFGPVAGIKDHQLPDLMRTLIGSKKCFNALAPAALAQAVREHLNITVFSFTDPWLWHLGLAKSFVVFALLLSRPPTSYSSRCAPGRTPSTSAYPEGAGL